MNAPLPLPEYQPVPIADQVRELRGQLAHHCNAAPRMVERHRMSEQYAVLETQRLQSALRTLEALEQLLGPDARLSKEELLQRLTLRDPAANATPEPQNEH